MNPPSLSQYRMRKDSRLSKPATSRNPVKTREKILKSAIRLFAAKGYDGVAVDDIIKAAKVNKRMVYHYFESKSGLYGAALSQVFTRLHTLEMTLSLEEESASAGIEKIIRAYFGFLKGNPEFVSLILWENLQQGKHLDTLPRELTKAPILQALDSMIARGIQNGEIRPGTDRRHMLINLIGLCQIYFSNRHTLTRGVGLNLSSPKELTRGINQAIELARYGFLTH